MPLELIVGAAIGAAASSSTLRKRVRSGLVYGLSSALIAYDRVAERAQSLTRSSAPAPAGGPVPATEAPASASPAESSGTSTVPNGKPSH